MNIASIRRKLNSLIGEFHDFLYIGLRGQNESFSGKIVKVYSRTFLIETPSGVLKSFSYSDFAIQVLRILS